MLPELNDLEAFWGGFWDQSGVHFEMIFATKLDRNCWVPWPGHGRPGKVRCHIKARHHEAVAVAVAVAAAVAVAVAVAVVVVAVVVAFMRGV